MPRSAGAARIVFNSQERVPVSVVHLQASDVSGALAGLSGLPPYRMRRACRPNVDLLGLTPSVSAHIVNYGRELNCALSCQQGSRTGRGGDL